MSSSELYQEIAAKIIASLEEGIRPWEGCFNTGIGFPVRVTGDQYQGINRFLLGMAMHEKGYTSPIWMTFNQARKLGGKVRKGEKSSLSVFFKQLEVEDKANADKTKIIPMVKRNNVFNVAQIDGLPEGFKDKFTQTPAVTLTPIEKAEAFFEAIPSKVIEAPQTPHYSPSKDVISMPPMGDFKTAEQYYAVKMHEHGHWTLHESRLNRSALLKDWSKENYAREELCAELTAAFVCPLLGIDSLIDAHHAPYIDSYIKILKSDPQAFLKACSQAQKAADYLRAFSEEKDEEAA